MQEIQKNSNPFDPNFNLALEKCKAEWKLPKHYKIISILGQGAYGCVVEARDTRTNKKVAIKRMANLFRSLGDTKRNLRELTLLRKLNHKCIVKLFDVIVEGDFKTFTTLYLVIEYFPSDLKKLFRSPIYLSNAHIALLSYNILLGLKYLKAAGVLHRDIKPANILINESCEIKICDFGLARAMNENIDDQLENSSGSQILDKPLNLLSDIQSMQSGKAEKFQQKIDQIFEDIPSEQLKNDKAISIYQTPNKTFKQTKQVLENSCQLKQIKTCEKAPHKGSIEMQPIHHNNNNTRGRIFSCDEEELHSQKAQQKRSYFQRLQKRGLTRHVVTRWYRAPEVILVEKNYNDKIDIWSFGCVFAEMQGAIKKNVKNYLDRRAIFPGISCYPLSPQKISQSQQEGKQKRSDQLQMIFQVIGTPASSELQWISDKNAQSYIENFEKFEAVNFSSLYPFSDPEAIQILKDVFRFNPKERCGVDELLERKFFSQFRKKSLEDMRDVEQVEMELELEETLNVEILREYFIKELIFYPQQE